MSRPQSLKVLQCLGPSEIGGLFLANYPLVNIQKAIEHGHFMPFMVDLPSKNGDLPIVKMVISHSYVGTVVDVSSIMLIYGLPMGWNRLKIASRSNNFQMGLLAGVGRKRRTPSFDPICLKIFEDKSFTIPVVLSI